MTTIEEYSAVRDRLRIDGVPEAEIQTRAAIEIKAMGEAAALENSRAALVSRRLRAKTYQDRTLAAFLDAGPNGMTGDEWKHREGSLQSTPQTTVSNLFKEGKILYSGRNRLTKAGRFACVYVHPVYAGA